MILFKPFLTQNVSVYSEMIFNIHYSKAGNPDGFPLFCTNIFPFISFFIPLNMNRFPDTLSLGYFIYYAMR